MQALQKTGNNHPHEMKTETSKAEINEAIAEACGWRYSEPPTNDPSPAAWVSPDGRYPVWSDDLPNYCNDLNAMHEAEKVLNGKQGTLYRLKLAYNSDGPNAKYCTVEEAMCHAKAHERAKAFLYVVNPTKAKEIYD